MRDLAHLDLCSGIGGFAIAAKRAGFRTVGFSEIDTYCCRVLAERFPGIRNFGDVKFLRAFTRLRYLVTLVTAGYPCQPESFAGERRGTEDDRWLWPAVRDVLALLRPPWFVGENVLGHVSMGLDQVLSDLEDLGYSAQPFVIPACAVGAWHRRDRVWIVAHLDRIGELEPRGRLEEICRRVADAVGGLDADLAGSRREGRDLQEAAGWSEPANLPAHVDVGGRQAGAGEQAGQSQPGLGVVGGGSAGDGPGGQPLEKLYFERSTEPPLVRVLHGIPNRAHRIKGLGNSIVPQVPEPILRVIAKIERGELISQ